MNEVLKPQQIVKEAQSAYKAGDYLAAAQSYEAARQGYLSANDSVKAAEMANNASVALQQAGDFEAALRAVEGSEAIFIQAGDRKSQAMALGNRAAALEGLKHLEEALDVYWQSAEILKELGETDLHLTVMQSISALQLRTGKQLQAVASMHAGVENIEKPTLKQRFLKRLLSIPMNMLNQSSTNELEDGTDHDG